MTAAYAAGLPYGPEPQQMTLSDDPFWSKVDTSGECWIWLGSKSEKRYGIFRRQRREVRAHRYAWELAFGPIPDGWDLHHACGNKVCVRPSHLRQIEHADHARLHQLEKTHCPHGHPYEGDNLVLDRRGWRSCRACDRAYYARRSREQRTAA